ncbi:MAG: YdbC family protein [Bacillota bacterium]
MAEIKYEIIESIGVLSESQRGWTKEINMVSWNNYPAKYDIREWDPEHVKMGKGVTLNKEEIKKLRDILNELELD